MKIHVGTSGFGYKEWKGKFYPEKILPGEMLHFYAERLRAVEINNTFYHMPTESVLALWAGQVPEDFVFAVKAPQIITHLKQLRHVEEETAYLFRTLAVLGDKLGPVLFQFSKSFKFDPSLLEAFLRIIPDNASCAFDFRSPSWFVAEVADLLRNKGCSLCIEDTDQNQVTEIITAAAWGYLRLRRADYDDEELSKWAERIASQKWEKGLVFFKHEEDASGPEIAMRFSQLIALKTKKSGKGIGSKHK